MITSNLEYLWYLACPYSTDDAELKQRRVNELNKIVGYLFNKGIFVFSPISEMHPVAQIAKLSGDWKTWAAYDELLISRCDGMMICALEGWDESVGIKAETKIAIARHMPITILDPETLEINYFNGLLSLPTP